MLKKVKQADYLDFFILLGHYNVSKYNKKIIYISYDNAKIFYKFLYLKIFCCKVLSH